jgi:hypothetical protein
LKGVWDTQATELRAKKDVGGIMIDAFPVNDNETCGTFQITVKPVGGGESTTFWRAGNSVWGKGTTYGSFIRLPPGRYEVTRVACGNYGGDGTFEGPHARFELRAGELVDLGVLRLGYERWRAVRRSVTGMSPQARALLKERMPKNFGFMRVRHMTAIVPGSGAPAAR